MNTRKRQLVAQRVPGTASITISIFRMLSSSFLLVIHMAALVFRGLLGTV